MPYRHKHVNCAKSTKELLENILKMKKAEYDIIEQTETVQVSNPMEDILNEETSINILPCEAEEILESEAVEVEVDSPFGGDVQCFDEYRSTLDFEVKFKEADDMYEKKRKKRNYLSGDLDYSDV